MCNMKVLSLLVRKLWPRLKFLSTHTRRRGRRRRHQGYDISSPDMRPGSLKSMCVSGYMPQKIRVGRSENLFFLFLLFIFLEPLIDIMIIMHDQGIENHDIFID